MGNVRTKPSDYIGQKFGRLTITGVELIKRGERSMSLVTALCDCGKTKKSLWGSIKSGGTKSCGCLNAEDGNRKCGLLGLIHGFSRHPVYILWRAIISRCYNKKHMHYKNYGGRGVTVCDEWRNDFLTFYNWAINNGWQKGLQIDKDINGDGKLYSPGACSFVTNLENARRKRNNIVVSYNGENKALSEWCELLGMKYTTIRRRLRIGMKPPEAFLKVRYA